jgi:hypothetical protein
MNLRTAVALTILATIIIIAVYPLFSEDAPPTPPIEVIEPPTPTIDQVPGTPYMPPAPPLPPTQSLIEKPGGAGGPCIDGNCPTQPQAGSGVQYRRFQWRRR